MLERIGMNPESFASGCLVWVPVAVMVISLVNWMIMSDIDVGSGLIGITVSLLIGFFAINPPDPLLPPLFFIAAVAMLVLAPVTRIAVNRSALSALEVEAIGRAYELLAAKPDNFGAKLRLARSLYNKGIRAHALAIADEALADVPERMFPEEHRMLNQWKESEAGHDAQVRIRCFECGIPNYPGTVFCTKCGAPYLLDFAQGRWVKSSTVRRVIAGWLAAMLALVGIPTAAVSLPPVVSIVVILVLVAAGLFMLTSGFRETSEAKH